MPNVIDSLVVELGFDASGMAKGRAQIEGILKGVVDVSDRSSKGVEANVKKMDEALEKLGKGALSLFALFTAGRGIKEFIEDITIGNATLGRLSSMIGTTAGALSNFQAAAELGGGSADGMAQSMHNLSQAFSEAQLTGNLGQLGAGLRALQTIPGVGRIEPNRNAEGDLDVPDLLKQIAPALQKLSLPKALSIGKMLGVDENTIYVLHQGGEALDDLLAKSKNLSDAQAKDAPLAMERLVAWRNLKQQFETIAIVLLDKLTPAFRFLSDVLLSVADWGQKFPVIFGLIASAITLKLIPAIGRLILSFLGFPIAAAAATGAEVELTAANVGLASSFVSLSGVIATGFVAAISSAGLVVTSLLAAVGAGAAVVFPALGEAIIALSATLAASPIGLIALGIAAIAAACYALYKLLGPLGDLWNSVFGSDKNKDITDKAASATSSPPSDVASADAWQAAQMSEARFGIPAKVTYAQWQLESGSGKNMPAGSNNPFGIKAVAGQPSVTAETTENIGGQNVKTMAQFAKYGSLAEAFDAHAKLLANSPKYKNFRDSGYDPNALTGIYATDTNYGNKLNSLIARNNRPASNASARISPFGLFNGSLQPAPAPALSLPYSLQGGASASALSRNAGNFVHTANNSKTDVNVGNVNVYTTGSDANKIANSIKPALERMAFVAPANYGAA